MPENPRFVSDDERFGAVITKRALQTILKECSASADNETGGVLIGRYTRDQRVAEITEATVPARDSASGAFTFWRGIDNLADYFKKLWRQATRTYYIGEWHSHPNNPASPSALDRITMVKIADSDEMQCPEPLLVIAGGDCSSADALSMHVFTSAGEQIELRRTAD